MALGLDLAFALVVAFIAGLALALPRFSPRELLFSVNVRAGFPARPEGRAILRRYQLRVLGVTAAALAVVVWGALHGQRWLAGAAPILQLGGNFWAYLEAHQETAPEAVPPAEAQLAAPVAHPVRPPGGWALQFVPFLILAEAASVLHANWRRIPLRFPVHWGWNGAANGWSARTVAGVFQPVVLGGIAVALIVLLTWFATRHTRRVAAACGTASAELARERRHLLPFPLVAFLIAAEFSWAAVLPLRAHPEDAPSMLVPLGLMAAFLLLLFLLFAVHRPQGLAPEAGAEVICDRAADRYWKAGMFYVNPNDPAILVPKRVGMGFTFNFARRTSWLILLVILLIAATPVLFARPH